MVTLSAAALMPRAPFPDKVNPLKSRVTSGTVMYMKVLKPVPLRSMFPVKY